ncbi:MAG: hypothetical protein HW397_276 [Dehalococcoidia bacterium]|nr:hypothetical protein [Dehalococcoidia bacterium]
MGITMWQTRGRSSASRSKKGPPLTDGSPFVFSGLLRLKSSTVRQDRRGRLQAMAFRPGLAEVAAGRFATTGIVDN